MVPHTPPHTESNGWYYVNGGACLGPCSTDELVLLFQKGTLPPETHIWTPGLTDWTQATDVAELCIVWPTKPQQFSRSAGLAGLLERIASTRPVTWHQVQKLFSQVTKRRTDADLEQSFATGLVSASTDQMGMRDGFPTPWFFARVLIYFGVAFTALWFGWSEFRNLKLLPGLMLIGSFAFPFAGSLFFLECNTARDIPLFIYAKLFLWGGILGILFALVGFEMMSTWSYLIGPPIAGIVEESAKLAAVIALGQASRFRGVLAGMALGAASAAGFSAFESAGYAFHALIESGSVSRMLDNIMLRGVLNPFGHVVWTAITVGAYWRVHQGNPFSWERLRSKRCARPIMCVMALHGLWNSPLPEQLPLFLGYLAIGVVGWYIALGMLLEGLHESRNNDALARLGVMPPQPR